MGGIRICEFIQAAHYIQGTLNPAAGIRCLWWVGGLPTINLTAPDQNEGEDKSAGSQTYHAV